MKKFSKLSKLLVLSTVSIFSFTGCENTQTPTDDAISALNGLVKEYGFIGYKNPLESSGSGTMVAGRPAALSFVAPASDCFSPDQLPRTLDTQHFNRTHNYQFQGNLGFTVLGTQLFSAGAGLNQQHTVSIEINGFTIEYLSSINVTDYYRDGMSSTCKEYLEDVGFIIQALSTDSMKISISKIDGTNIGLDVDNIGDYIEFEAGTDWQIVNNYTVQIQTPKYIGYQLGRLRTEDRGRVLYRAVRADEDRFVFEDIRVFQVPEDEKREEFVSL